MAAMGTSHGLRRVLIVDDDEDDIFFHSRTLRAVVPDLAIDTAAGGDEAIDHLSNPAVAVPDLILLDVNMPRRSGWDFISDYEGLPDELRQAKVVMLTSSDAPRDRDRADSSRAVSDYLTKPLQQEDVERLIGRFFS